MCVCVCVCVFRENWVRKGEEQHKRGRVCVLEDEELVSKGIHE